MSKRNYQNDYPSVTQILGILRKIGLELWFKHNTAQFCDDKSNKGKKIGTEIHTAIQSYIETGKAEIKTEHNVEVTNALKSFMEFRKENPSYILSRSELPLTSEQYKFNGTIDCLGEGMMWDWKTAECKDKEKPVIYDEWKYQVAAYVYLYNEANNTNIQSAGIVAICKDKISHNFYPMNKEEIDDCFNEVFLSCLKIYNHQRKEKDAIRNADERRASTKS